MSNSLDPDQARHFVGPDLGPNCLKKVISRRQRSLLAGQELNINYGLAPSDMSYVLRKTVKRQQNATKDVITKHRLLCIK